jgi:hypothetical protein
LNHEACDDGNAVNVDACTNDCTLPIRTWTLWPMPNPASAELPNPASYDTSKAGVVTDKITGLAWQRVVPAGSYDLSGATDYCAGLDLGGFADWRLPSRIELVSLLDFTVATPTIDAQSFPSTPAAHFWTSTPYLFDPAPDAFAWAIYFDNAAVQGDEKVTLNRVRCVR